MIGSRVAAKYAVALFRAAQHAGELERISDDLRAVSGLLRKDPRLKDFLESPQVSEKEKRDLLGLSLKPSISPASFSFLVLVLEKHRIQYLESMAEEFEKLFKENQGIVEARLITARELDQTLRHQIREELEKHTGKRIQVHAQVESGLIGGAVVMVGDKVIDRSVRHQLNRLREQMSALKVHEST
jgi:F-type H+-transporting ATPase subunit delta